MAFGGPLPNTMAASIRRYDLLHKRLERFTQMLQGLDEGDVHALHQARVASRRLREILPVLQVDADVARRLGRKLRKVTQRLGTVRELDVLSLLIDELQASGRYDTQALRRIASAIGEERAHAREKLLTKLPTEELHRIAGKLNKVAGDLKTGKSSRGWRWAIEARITHRASVLKDALVDAGALYLPERLHAVRIAVKKLRYASEVSVEASGLKTKGELRSLKRGQDILGRLHDMQVLLDRVRQLQASLTPPDVTMWRKLDALTTALENDCRRVHARFMRQRTVVLTVCDRSANPKVSAATARRAAS
jgi:CHAD domain-containing protein